MRNIYTRAATGGRGRRNLRSAASWASRNKVSRTEPKSKLMIILHQSHPVYIQIQVDNYFVLEPVFYSFLFRSEPTLNTFWPPPEGFNLFSDSFQKSVGSVKVKNTDSDTSTYQE